MTHHKKLIDAWELHAPTHQLLTKTAELIHLFESWWSKLRVNKANAFICKDLKEHFY